MKLKTKHRAKWLLKKVLKFLLVIIFVLLLFAILYTLWEKVNVRNSTSIGIFGVLAGSTLTGIITYLNTGQSHIRDSKKKEMEFRKNEIYVPLYENLLKFISTLNDFQYPLRINVNPDYEEMVGFTEWAKIKKEVRYLSVNKALKNELENFINLIEQYNEIANEYVSPINKVIDDCVSDAFNGSLYLNRSFKYNDLKYLLIDKKELKVDLQKRSLLKRNPHGWSDIKISNDTAEEIINKSMSLASTTKLSNQNQVLLAKSQEFLDYFKMTIQKINKEIYGKIDY